MKMILAVIPPDRLESVKNELSKIEVFRLTIMDVQGFGTARASVDSNSAPDLGRQTEINLTRRVQLMVGVNDDFLTPTIEAIQNGVRGNEGEHFSDGKIFIMPLEDCIRIRTGERGSEAI